MTDLHCHILHGIDDGPSELDESLELCRLACSNNISQIVLTPHLADFGTADEFLVLREERIQELRHALDLRSIKVDLFAGAEVYISDEIYYLDGLERFAINQTRYILLEFPYSGLSFRSLAGYIREVKSRRLIPVVAHPERYTYLQHDYRQVDFLLHEGVLFQVNVGSLCRGGRKSEYKLAWEMISRRHVSFLATDAHSVDYRPNNLLDMLLCLPREIDSDYIDKLVNKNPDAVLSGLDIAV